MRTVEETRSPAGNRPLTRTAGPAQTGTVRRVAAAPTTAKCGGAIDHWSIVLFYSMGIGTLAVAALLLATLMAVWFYGQFIWAFTHWDLSNVRLRPFKPLADFILLGVFMAGTCLGLWCFSGLAWSKPHNQRSKSIGKKRQ